MQDSSNVTYYYFQPQLRGTLTKAANLKAIEKPREEGRGKRKPCPPPPLFWHINLTSVSPLESSLTLPNSLGFNFLTVIVPTAKYVKYVCFEG